jgi:hypothetical protein
MLLLLLLLLPPPPQLDLLISLLRTLKRTNKIFHSTAELRDKVNGRQNIIDLAFIASAYCGCMWVLHVFVLV